MHKFVQQQVTAWLAFLAVLFGTLAPTLSHATAQAHLPLIEMQLCSSAGMKTVFVELGEQPAPDRATHLAEHCPYCSQNHHLPALLPAARLVLPIALRANAYPARFYQSATPLLPWSAASARAPPILS